MLKRLQRTTTFLKHVFFPRKVSIDRKLLQQPHLEELIQSYIEWSHLSGSCNPNAAENAIRSVYQATGRPHPHFLWFDSPYVGIRATVLWTLAEFYATRKQDKSYRQLLADGTAILQEQNISHS